MSERDLGLAVELIGYGIKVPLLSAMTGIHPKLARQLYREHAGQHSEHAPNGRTRSIESTSMPRAERRRYVALACEYRNALRRGANALDAQVGVYRQFRNVRAFTGAEVGAVCINAWFTLCQELDRGAVRLVRCARCAGHDLVDRSHDANKRCTWCGRSAALEIVAPVQARLEGIE